MTTDIRAALERLLELDKSSPMQDGQWATKHENAIADAIKALEAEPAGEGLAPRVLAMCKQRNWGLDWMCRGAYLHLEASELIEALRGKRGDPTAEAADVLLVLMSITENAGIAWADVVQQTAATCSRLEGCDQYPGEERMDNPAAPPAPEAGEQPVSQPYKLPEPGEVAELVEWLEAQAIVYGDYLQSRSGSKRLTRTATLLRQFSAPAPAAVPEVQRDAVIAAVTEALGNAYDCQRVWEAWGIGTMGADDFALVADDPDRVAEIADAVIEALHPAAPPAPLPLGYIDPEHQGDDRELLEAFYRACNAEGGTADEIHLRGLRAVLEARPAAPPAPEPGPPISHTERLRIVKHGICAGYNLGHHHTVEGGWGDPDEVAADYAEETLTDLGDEPPAVVPVAVEALTRLYRWGGIQEGRRYDSNVVLGVRHWIDGGMVGGLPQLPRWIADRCPPLPQGGEGES